MKIGITYLYTIFRYGYPPNPRDDFKALANIGKMGFHFLEMEGLGRQHAAGVWKHRKDFKHCLDDHGIHVHNFCGVDPDLVSLDAPKRKAALSRFQRTAELGAYLGAETLHLASYAPPVKYRGKAPYELGDDYSFGDGFDIAIPRGFSWRRVWDALVASCQFTADVAAQFGRTIIMEPRVGEVICSVDSMLRLIHDVGRENFRANFDTAHFSAQRENVPLALMKLEGKFANIHIADNDPRATTHLPIGRGKINWREFFRILKQMNYRGYLGLDLGGRDSIEKDYRQSLEYLQGVAGELKIPLQW